MRTGLACAFLGGLLLSSCATPAEAPPPSAVSAADYRLGPNDKVRVIVFGEPTLSGEYAVSASGEIAIPLIGNIQAAGLTPSAVQGAVIARLSQGFIKNPDAAVELLAARPFYILGEVEKPGAYPYTSGLTVLDAVATAGGFTYRANQKIIHLRHRGQTAERKTRLEPDMAVQPGDVLRVGERYF